MKTIKKMARLKWVSVVSLCVFMYGLGSRSRVRAENAQGVYEPNDFGFQLGGTWPIPFLGNGPAGGFLGFGSDDSGFSIPGFGFGGGGSFEGGTDGHGISFGGNGGIGGGFDGGFGGGGSGGYDRTNPVTCGCSYECLKTVGGFITAGDGSGSDGGSNAQQSLSSRPNLDNGGKDGGNYGGQYIRFMRSFTCKPMNCPSDGDCGGYGRYSSSQYWCDVPGFGVYPFTCPGGLDKSGRSSNCIPLVCPSGAACQDLYPGHGGQQNGARKSKEAGNTASEGHK